MRCRRVILVGQAVPDSGWKSQAQPDLQEPTAPLEAQNLPDEQFVVLVRAVTAVGEDQHKQVEE